MHRIDGAGHVNNLFVSEDPATNRPPTEITPEIMNAFQQELAAIVEWSGAALDKADNGQVLTALIAKFADRVAAATKAGVQNMTYSAALAGGAANAITAVYDPPITALVHGMSVRVRAGSANTTTTPTFTPNSVALAAKTIVKGNNLALVAGDISGAGHWLDFQWDQTLDKWVLLNPAKGVSISSVDATKQPLDATLTALAALVTSADKMIYSTGVDAFSLTTLTAFARTFLAGADSAEMRSILGIIGCTYSLGTTGWIVFPVWFLNGFTIVWGGGGSLTGNNGLDVVFPLAFSVEFYRAFVVGIVAADGDGPTICYRSPTLTGLRINNGTTETATAVGYIAFGR